MFLKWMNQTWNVNIVGVPYRAAGQSRKLSSPASSKSPRWGSEIFSGSWERARSSRSRSLPPAARSSCPKYRLSPRRASTFRPSAGGDGPPRGSAARDRGQAQYRVGDALSGGEIRRVSREASRAAGTGNACRIRAIPQARPPGCRILDQNLQSIARGLQAAAMNESRAVAYLACISDLRLRRDEQRA